MIERMTSVWDAFRGHAATIAMFRRAAGRGRLAQGYLFAGPAGVGKRTFARNLAQCLFCERFEEATLDACGTCGPCRQFLAGSHPDYFEIGCPEGKRELPIAAFLGEEDGRGRSGLCYELALRPMAGSRRVAVIDDADAMNEAAANAFLKTLEEPQPGAVLMLIAAQPDRMLPTIRSRCQAVRFGPLSDADVADLLVARDPTTDRATAESAAVLAEGSVETAVRLLDPTLRGLRATVLEEFARKPFDPAKAAERLGKGIEPAGDLAAQREATGWLARFAADLFRQAAVAATGGTDAGPAAALASYVGRPGDPQAAIDALADLTDRAAAVEDRLALYTSPALCIEALAYDVAERVRAG